MTRQFNSYVEDVDVDYWRRLCIEQGELRHYARDEEFISAGTVARYIGYVRKGALKYVCYGDDGTEHVVGLEFAGHFVCDFPFSLYNEKSRCSIIATTDSEIHCISVKSITERMKSDPELRDIIALATKAVFGMVYDRLMAFYTKTPRERYYDLITLDPNLFQQFSLKDIASLLRITPTHLSRLRAEINKC